MAENTAETDFEPSEKLHPLLAMTYCEIICIILLLAGLMTVKLFFPKLFAAVRKNYEKQFLTETSVTEILDALPEDQAELFREA